MEEKAQPAVASPSFSHDWLVIPILAGYWIGGQSKDPQDRNYDPEAFDFETVRQVDILAFRIGRYPVTVAPFLQFVIEAALPSLVRKHARSSSRFWQASRMHSLVLGFRMAGNIT